jgi:hypothetical protein
VQPVDGPQLVIHTAIAVERLLTSLDDVQRDRACFPFDDGDGSARRDWHYVPRARPGLCLADLRTEQQKTVLGLLRTGTTETSFATACLVMALEDVLDDREEGRGPRRGKQRPWGRHRAEYHVALFGEPGDHAWGWRVEGHHLSVNVTVVGGRTDVSVTPQFLGANPANVAGAYRLLAPEQDLALALVAAMTPAERAAAIVADAAPDDILTTNAPSLDAAVLLPPEGVALDELTPVPRAIAHDLVEHYASRLPEDVDRDGLRFAFAGEPAGGRPHYYRIQGTRLLVEYDNTQDGANHVHTVVRDRERDFGDDLLRAHRATHHAAG